MNNNKERYNYLKLKGLCPRCGGHKLDQNKVLCISCREELSDAAKRNYKNKSNKEKKSRQEYTTRKKQLCRAFGVCVRCMKSDAEKGVLCLSCWQKVQSKRKSKEKIHVDRSERIRDGLCYLCGRPAVEDYKLCDVHLESYQSNMRKIRELSSYKHNLESIYNKSNTSKHHI